VGLRFNKWRLWIRRIYKYSFGYRFNLVDFMVVEDYLIFYKPNDYDEQEQ
jgi:hypothetical protein